MRFDTCVEGLTRTSAPASSSTGILGETKPLRRCSRLLPVIGASLRGRPLRGCPWRRVSGFGTSSRRASRDTGWHHHHHHHRGTSRDFIDGIAGLRGRHRGTSRAASWDFADGIADLQVDDAGLRPPSPKYSYQLNSTTAPRAIVLAAENELSLITIRFSSRRTSWGFFLQSLRYGSCELELRPSYFYS